MTEKPISKFIKRHFRHFNAATVVDAAEAYQKHLENGGKMFVTLAGAMSTAELGISLAEMIRQEKVHAISCTGANLEEDIYNLVAHDHYKRLPNYRDLTPKEEKQLYDERYNRVTDTCIPEQQAMLKIEKLMHEEWKNAEEQGKRYFPHELFYKILKEGRLEKSYQIEPKDSWMIAAADKNIPLFVPGWEDSTLGNGFVGYHMRGQLKDLSVMKTGLEYMKSLAVWYLETSKHHSIGFFQVGGGIAGDFPICVVPMLHFDLKIRNAPLWGYFCQISDSTTSYGSYSGAVPNEKITWGKLGTDTPKFVIESDATIVAPLIFAMILGW
ncbi:MAG: deoxyhypusine synthase family protein [Deltaproteobacteria bacterium]|nr:deoxyhypusine synthase family protein [Deltaproteobacteria bacterium]MBI2500430.1 deoxyhypusine synthase family protein [Deltaproteobacteria bacterium]